ncbi:hydrolase TatD [Candidatus Wolfebacteria bacterium]|nr:MAG: hydrolase TatD [Candidatus Wolfebacteria bacterium]
MNDTSGRKFEFFDAHSHLNLDPLTKEKDEIIKTLEEENIGTITIGTDMITSKDAIEISKKSEMLFAGVGLHPTDVENEEFSYEKYSELAKDPSVVCIGECGLDYFRLKGDSSEIKDKQKEVFKKQIELALEHDLPLMLHCRPTNGSMDAYEDVLDILESYMNTHCAKLRGNSHFFVGDLNIAKRFLDLEFTLSFPGVITFARDYDDVVRYIPLHMILSETDAPFAAPEPYRGKTNMPHYVKEIVKKIAELKGLEYEKVKKVLVENVKRVFSI